MLFRLVRVGRAFSFGKTLATVKTPFDNPGARVVRLGFAAATIICGLKGFGGGGRCNLSGSFAPLRMTAKTFDGSLRMTARTFDGNADGDPPNATWLR